MKSTTSISTAVGDFLARHKGCFSQRKPTLEKVLVLGLDGGSLEILSPFIEAGLMPNLKRIIEGGASGVLTSTIVPMTALAWPAALSGKNPGKLGTFTFRKRQTNSYELRSISASDIDSPMVWDILSQKGASCCVLNVPLTYPPRRLNGIMVNSWEAPSPSEAVITYPPEFTAYLNKSRYSTAGPWHKKKYVRTNFLQLLELSQALMKADWDFFMVVFHQIDTLSHFYYGRTSIWKEILAMLDYGIGELLAGIDDKTNVVVFSDHGIRYYKRIFSLSNWLNERGYMCSRKNSGRSPLAGMKDFARNVPLTGAAAKVYRKLVGKTLSRSSHTDLGDFIDWSRSRAYAYEYTSANYGAIRVNLKGREPAGTVYAGKDYDNLMTQITEELLRIRDGENKVVLKVHNRNELYWGTHTKELPDLIFQMNDEYTVNSNLPHVNREMFYDNPREFHAGHAVNGMVVLQGANIVPGKVIAANIADIAPTILYLTGSPAPSDMDGRVMMQAVTPEHAKETPPGKERAGVALNAKTEVVSSLKHQQQLRDKLRSLGYID